MAISNQSNKFIRFFLLFCILKVMIDTTISSGLPSHSENEYSTRFIDIVPKRSKIVRRALHEEVKDKVETPNDFIVEHVTTTNAFRALHGVGPLEIDYQLCLDAEEFAKELAQMSRAANKIIVSHSTKRNTGESILGGQNIAKATGKFCAEHWYNENKKHNWADNFFNKATGHFTQLIWKETTSMGIAQVNIPSTGDKILNITIVVARYIPPGNWAYRSSFKENVLPLIAVPPPASP